jgi:transcriptional regulator with XRE-family HTH domain
VARSPNPTDKHVGTRVRMCRLMLGLTQMQLADELSIAFQQVQKYEKGTNRISASRLHQISSFLQVPIPFFFEGLPDPSNKLPDKDAIPLQSDVFQFLTTTDGISLAKSFMHIKRSQLRHAIVNLVEGLADKAPQ